MADEKRVLIVEDDKDISMVEEAYLEFAGFQTVTVGNGGEVSGLLEKEAFDLILLDLMLPGKSGYEVCREIRFPNREFELLKFLAMNPNIVFSKEQLFEKIWGYDYTGDNATVMVHINRIRDKIEDDSKNPKILKTVCRACPEEPLRLSWDFMTGLSALSMIWSLEGWMRKSPPSCIWQSWAQCPWL